MISLGPLNRKQTYFAWKFHYFSLQGDKLQLKRCYVSMYNADQDFLSGFSMQKARGAGPVQILHSSFAFNEGSGAAEGYMEFHDEIWSNNLIDRL